MIHSRNTTRDPASRWMVTPKEMMLRATFHGLTILLLGAAGALAQTSPAPPAGPSDIGPTGNEDGLPDFLRIYDVDGDSTLSEEERQAMSIDRKRHLKFRQRWDTDQDGTVSDDEVDAAKARIRQIIIRQRLRRFQEMDTDDAAGLSRAEFGAIPAVQNSDANSPGNATSLFDLIDVNPKDDVISAEEFVTAIDNATTPRDHVDSTNGGDDGTAVNGDRDATRNDP